MEYREWHNRTDKDEWGDGPWTDEADKAQWTDEETGFACLIVRGPLGSLCGYVGVPEGHPWYELDRSEIRGARAYWGVNFSSFCQETDDEGHGVCHAPDPGEPDNVWWLGFDCGHISDDYVPGLVATSRKMGLPGLDWYDETPYRDLEFVKACVTELALSAQHSEESWAVHIT